MADLDLFHRINALSSEEESSTPRRPTEAG